MKKNNIGNISSFCLYFFFLWLFFGNFNSCEVKKVELVSILDKPSFSLEDIDKKFSCVDLALANSEKKLSDIDDRLKICESQLQKLDLQQIDKEKLDKILDSCNYLINKLNEYQQSQQDLLNTQEGMQVVCESIVINNKIDDMKKEIEQLRKKNEALEHYRKIFYVAGELFNSNK